MKTIFIKMNKLDGINLEFNFNLFFEFRYVQHVSTYMIVIFFIKKNTAAIN